MKLLFLPYMAIYYSFLPIPQNVSKFYNGRCLVLCDLSAGHDRAAVSLQGAPDNHQYPPPPSGFGPSSNWCHQMTFWALRPMAEGAPSEREASDILSERHPLAAALGHDRSSVPYSRCQPSSIPHTVCGPTSVIHACMGGYIGLKCLFEGCRTVTLLSIDSMI